MWIAVRDSVNARTDEDKAMAHKEFGRGFTTREEARQALLDGMRDEVAAWADMGLSSGAIRVATAMGMLLGNSALNGITHECLYFGIREYGVRS